jgi:hypothetical protein
MESYRSALHSQRSSPERDTFLYLALGAVSIALSLLERLRDGSAEELESPPGGPPTDRPPRGLLR